jgi:hypothetical protein
VRHQQHDAAAGDELVHLVKQFAGLLVGQRRIRLVEQKHLRIARHRAGDLGALLGRERAIGEQAIGEPVDAERLHHLRVGGAESGTAGARALAPDQHVLGDGEVGEQLRFMMDDGDGAPIRRRRPGSAVERQFAALRPAADRDRRQPAR